MSAHRLFICYCHADADQRDRLMVSLKPHVGKGLLEHVWYDGKIVPGEKWRDEIFEAIDTSTAAVVLVSPDLLASSFVMNEELPRLFRARRDRKLLLLALFVRPCHFEMAEVEIEGVVHSLAAIQGLNDPAGPIGAGDGSDGRRKTAVDGLLRAFAERTKVDQNRRPNRELQVELRRNGDSILRRAGRPPYFDDHSNHGRIPRALLDKKGSSHDPEDETYGRDLFELLLGPERDQLALVSRIAGEQSGIVDRHAFRVRIYSPDPKLRELPWSLARTSTGEALVDRGWTFELARNAEPEALCELQSPTRTLFVGAEVSGLDTLRVNSHLRAFEGLLQRSWNTPLRGTLLQHASNRSELEAALRNAPRQIYLYAHARTGRNGPELLLAGPDGQAEPLPFDELAELLHRHPPKVVLLDTPEDIAPLPELKHIDAVVQLRATSDSWTARQYALDWWQFVLLQDLSPAAAFCLLPAAARTRGLVTTHYRRWKHEHRARIPKIDRARAYLDRRDQRERVRHAVEDLVHLGERRLTCMVIYGSQGNLVEHFATQLDATLRDRAHDLARLVRHSLCLPDERKRPDEPGGLNRALIREYFRDGLRLQPMDGLDRAFGHEARGPKAQPVHFFDWGTYPSSKHGPALVSSHLEQWVDFCCSELAVACPKQEKGIAYLGLVTQESKHALLEDVLRRLGELFHTNAFELVAVPPLDTVDASDLRNFLSDPSNSSCPPDLVNRLAARIVKKTGGQFEETVSLLENAERTNHWYLLDEELPEVGSTDRSIPNITF